MQAKLDELIRAIDDARGRCIGIEDKTEREIDTTRTDLEKERQDAQEAAAGKPNSDKSIETLIYRRRVRPENSGFPGLTTPNISKWSF
jgi:low affinity Fe/Cu permease